MTKEELIGIIKNKKSAPFLFLGSGFTKHYLNTPTWEELLSRFASKHINAYYTSLGTYDLSVIASEIAKEENKSFWDLPNDNKFKQSFQDKAISTSSVLKYKIATFLKELTHNSIPEKYTEELELLKTINIDGIITTNWDDLIEILLPKLTKYVGQEELIFSSVLNIGEIYKVHGCVYQPETMVLTKEDYNGFNDKNTYLAAKLITIFIEHPIVFIGYSINDSNIKEILSSIVKCLNQEKIKKLQNNLFFVEWNPDENSDFMIQPHDITMEHGFILPVTRIITHEYKPVYECLATFERGIPTHLLRLYKKQFYEIVFSEKPEKQLYALPGKDIDVTPNIQVVYGFGAIDKYKSAVGYTGLKAINLFRDIVDNNGNYEHEIILTKTIPELRKNTKFIPCYKYLKAVGIISDETYNRSDLNLCISIKMLSNSVQIELFIILWVTKLIHNKQPMYAVLDKDTIKNEILPHLSVAKRGFQSKSSLIEVINAILYKLKTGCQWEYLPVKELFSGKVLKYGAVFHHYNKWSKKGEWKSLWLQLLDKHRSELDMSSVDLDGSHTPAIRGGEEVGYQGRKKRKTTNALYLTDRKGLPLAMSVPKSGEHHDTHNIVAVMQNMMEDMAKANIRTDGLFLNADAGFDCAALRSVLKSYGIVSNICINKRNGTTNDSIVLDELLYRERYSIERTNAWMDSFRTILNRFDTTLRNWESWNYIAFSIMLLRKCARKRKV